MRLIIIVSDHFRLPAEAASLLPRENVLEYIGRGEIEFATSSLSESAIVVTDISFDLARELERLEEIRRIHAAALVVLAPELTHEERLLVLEAGADQLLVNPPDPREIALVLRNLGRLLPAGAARARAADSHGAWLLNDMDWYLQTPLGDRVPLQRAEVAVLARLFARPGVNQSREILAASFKADHEDKNRSLDVLISKIRKKVRDVSDLGFPLRAVRGVGYIFVGNAKLTSAALHDAPDRKEYAK